MEWILATVPYLKAVHIAALFLWCGGLLAMPLMLTRHDPAHSQEDYRRIRSATHLTYTMMVTPAAVAAVIAGTWLIFLREAFVPWLYAKLFFVVVLVGAHAWIGHIVVSVAETTGRHRPPPAYLPIAVLLTPMAAILVLVLGKPELGGIAFPDWLTEPRGGQLPFEMPRR
jgi:protoporphyrinogen IX oxidase